MANIISKVLYPNDNHYEGKTLRRRRRISVSATLQYAIRDFKNRFGNDWSKLPDKAVFTSTIRIRLCYPGLMRILMDEEGLGWEEAQAITSRCVAYTNHTVMQEAMERWPQELVKRQLPRIYDLEELNRRLGERL